MSNVGRSIRRRSRNDLPLLCALIIRKETLPDRFIGISSFAFRMACAHSFQCKQRAIAADVECARCARDVRQPWRRSFFFELFGWSLLRPIELTDVDEAHGVEHIPYST